MLKITYLESGLYLEQLPEPVEDWLALRMILTLRMGQRLVVEPSTASLLIPAALITRSRLARLAHTTDVTLSPVDDADVEVVLSGVWLASGGNEEGVFVAMLHPAIEQMLLQLWQEAQLPTSMKR
ncbi:MAG: hypothetical protein IGS38_14835 [Synechococcales cyanobacterium M58_A2018_015]|nr:hypothetical protein [Synechococcales cyanobacterium M58_A2018_015]